MKMTKRNSHGGGWIDYLMLAIGSTTDLVGRTLGLGQSESTKQLFIHQMQRLLNFSWLASES